MKFLDFYEEIMSALAGPHCYSRTLFMDMYDLKVWILEGINQEETYRLLCHCALRMAKHTKSRLPDSLHNRMILGEQNHYTRSYVKLVSKWDQSQVSVT